MSMSEPKAGTEMAGDIPYEEPTLDSFREGGQCNCHVCLNIRRDGFLKRAARLSPAPITEAVAWRRPSVGCRGKGIYDVETFEKPKGDDWEPLYTHPIGETGDTDKLVETMAYAVRFGLGNDEWFLFRLDELSTAQKRSAKWNSPVEALVPLSALGQYSTQLEAALAAEKQRADRHEQNAVETQMLAFKWMEAHDKRTAGKPYDLPTVADVPNTIARVAALEGALTWAIRQIDPVMIDTPQGQKRYDDVVALAAPVTTPPAETGG